MGEVCRHIVRWEIPKTLCIGTCVLKVRVIEAADLTETDLLNRSQHANQPKPVQQPNRIRLTSQLNPAPKPLTSPPKYPHPYPANNRLTHIRSLRKSHFPSLLSCSLGGNRILDYIPLSELHTPGLKNINQENRADLSWCGTFSWIAKLETN